MMKPLALLLHDATPAGARLEALFEGLEYRVAALADPAQLTAAARDQRPMLAVVDLENPRGDAVAAIAELRAAPDTAHIAVLAYASSEREALREEAARAGAQLALTELAILQHLPHFLEQALALD